MAKYSGKIGIGVTVDKGTGIYVVETTEQDVFGEFLQLPKSQTKTAGLNDDISVSNRISIYQNTFVMENLGNIKYITYAGIKWKVTSIEVNYPRLILTTGGEWNDESRT